MSEFTNRVDFGALGEKIDQIRSELGSRIIGQEEMIHQMLIALLAKGHVLIEGVPGVAKTLSAKALAQCIDARFSRLQFTPDLMPSDVLGTTIFNQKTNDFELRKGPVYANIVLIDEINRAPAKTQAALFEAMEEFQVTVDGQTIKLDDPFMVLATQNPVEHEGTYRLPEAQLDRFMLKIEVSYPEEAAETRMLERHHELKEKNPLDGLQSMLSVGQLLEFRQAVKQVAADTALMGYITVIVRQTRFFNGIYLGASPRAGVSLMNAAKATAALAGRDFITPDDVKYVAKPVLRHRILLSPEKEMEGVSPDAMISQVLDKIEVPR